MDSANGGVETVTEDHNDPELWRLLTDRLGYLKLSYVCVCGTE